MRKRDPVKRSERHVTITRKVVCERDNNTQRKAVIVHNTIKRITPRPKPIVWEPAIQKNRLGDMMDGCTKGVNI